jgi:TonB family protein
MNKLNAIKKGLLSAAAMGALLVPVAVGVLRGGPALAQDDADVRPLVRIAPEYPPEAVAQGLEGHVVLEFTITAEGATSDISVVESSAAIFEQPSIDALSKWRYSPRVSDGARVERTGVHTVIRFALSRDEPAAIDKPVVATPEE